MCDGGELSRFKWFEDNGMAQEMLRIEFWETGSRPGRRPQSLKEERLDERKTSELFRNKA